MSWSESEPEGRGRSHGQLGPGVTETVTRDSRTQSRTQARGVEFSPSPNSPARPQSRCTGPGPCIHCDGDLTVADLLAPPARRRGPGLSDHCGRRAAARTPRPGPAARARATRRRRSRGRPQSVPPESGCPALGRQCRRAGPMCWSEPGPPRPAATPVGSRVTGRGAGPNPAYSPA